MSEVGAVSVQRADEAESIDRTAKKRALGLYSALREIEMRTGEFVVSLDEVADAMWEARKPSTKARAAVDSQLVELRRITSDLRAALEEVKRAVAAIDPQLEIHQPEISRGIDQFIATRGILIEKVEDLTPYLEAERST